MALSDKYLPIIRLKARFEDYPFKALAPPVVDRLRAAALSNMRANNPHFVQRVERLLKVVEACLRVTRRSIDSVYSGDFESTCGLIIGALGSSRFLEGQPSHRSDYIGIFRAALIELNNSDENIIFHSALFTNLTRSIEKDIVELTCLFESLELDEEQAWLWHGWQVVSLADVSKVLPLYKVYATLGREFTSTLYESISIFVGTRAIGVLPCIKSLANFIADFPESVPTQLRSFAGTALTPQLLRKPSFGDIFWRSFVVYHTTTSYNNGVKLSTVAAQWNGNFRSFVIEHLIHSQLIAINPSGFPKLEIPRVRGDKTHLRISSDGIEYRCKLLTDVPMSVTDEEAIRILFSEIENDLNLIREWCQHEVDETNGKLARRKELAKLGTPRLIQKFGSNDPGHKWLTNPKNPDWLANAASTFDRHGFCTTDDTDISLLYQSRKIAARELGLPMANVLNPYLLLLVAQHPSITPAFLRSIELFNKNGVRTGLTCGDEGPMLHGFKRRRGPSLAAQDISLTPEGYSLVVQIIELTQPLREYLRKKRDRKWRYLLLSCGIGFGQPLLYRPDPTGPHHVKANAKRLASFCGVSLEKAMSLCRRTRLPTVRASAGVLVYLRTQSVEEMASALGHAEYDEALLSHYLPKPIAEFFRERWIRLFQAGIVLEALKDSPYRFQAAGFPNPASMNEFLKNHAIAGIESDETWSEGNNSHIVFTLDLDILTLLATLISAIENASRPIHPVAAYWCTVAQRLFGYIESPQCIRHDFRLMLAQARTQIDIALVEKVLYA